MGWRDGHLHGPVQVLDQMDWPCCSWMGNIQGKYSILACLWQMKLWWPREMIWGHSRGLSGKLHCWPCGLGQHWCWLLCLAWSCLLWHGRLRAVENWGIYGRKGIPCKRQGSGYSSVPLSSLEQTFSGLEWTDQPPPNLFKNWQMWSSLAIMNKQQFIIDR